MGLGYAIGYNLGRNQEKKRRSLKGRAKNFKSVWARRGKRLKKRVVKKRDKRRRDSKGRFA